MSSAPTGVQCVPSVDNRIVLNELDATRAIHAALDALDQRAECKYRQVEPPSDNVLRCSCARVAIRHQSPLLVALDSSTSSYTSSLWLSLQGGPPASASAKLAYCAADIDVVKGAEHLIKLKTTADSETVQVACTCCWTPLLMWEPTCSDRIVALNVTGLDEHVATFANNQGQYCDLAAICDLGQLTSIEAESLTVSEELESFVPAFTSVFNDAQSYPNVELILGAVSRETLIGGDVHDQMHAAVHAHILAENRANRQLARRASGRCSSNGTAPRGQARLRHHYLSEPVHVARHPCASSAPFTSHNLPRY